MISVPERVKDALRSGSYLKNYRFNVLGDNGNTDFTIDNDTLVSESVKFDERMCTGKQLKFGLCEGSSLEFQYFDHDNITGRQIQAFIDVQFVDADGQKAWHTIPMGFFTVDQCPMQFSTGIRKVTAYNKLKSDYLDQKCNDAIVEAAATGDPGRTGVTSIGTFLQTALNEYAVEPEFEKEIPQIVGYHYYLTPSPSKVFPHLIVYKKNQQGEYIPINGNPNPSSEDEVYTWPVFSVAYLRTLDIASIGGVGYYRTCAIREKVQELYYDAVERSGLSDAYIYDTVASEYVPFSEYYARPANSFHRIVCDDAYDILYPSGDDNVVDFFGDDSEQDYLRTKYFYFDDASDYPDFMVHFPAIWLIDKDTYDETYVRDRHISEINDAIDECNEKVAELQEDYQFYSYDRRIDTEMEELALTQEQAEALPDVTLRELQSAVFESACQYGQLDRVTDLFKGVDLNHEHLYPADDLYPANDLYPNGNALRTNRSMYQKLWTDSQGVQTFRYLIITYKTTETEEGQTREVDKTLQRTVNANGTTDYNMSDNWLFRNLIWTEEQVGEYADAMVAKMQAITWFPFEMWCAGLPYLETGDELEITNSEGTYTSYILQRQLNGIQNLQDTYIDGELDIF